MWLFQQANATRYSLAYITVGALLTTWTLVWYSYLSNHPPESHAVYYLCGGSLASGIVLFLIGASVGLMSQAEPPAAAGSTASVSATTVAPEANGIPAARIVAAPEAPRVIIHR
jgi:hypothetical protein